MNPSIEEATKRLLEAIENGDLEQVQHWIPLSDLKNDDHWPFRLAVLNDQTAMVSLLLPAPDDVILDTFSLYIAAMHGHDDIIALIIDRFDPETTWKTLLRDKIWGGLDTLAPYVPSETVMTALTLAPNGAMPKTESRILEQTLGRHVPISTASNPKHRI